LKNFSKNIVLETISAFEILKLLDNEKTNQTLFVVNSDGKMVGTITDGDIRRGLINGLSINNLAKDFCNSRFKYLSCEINVKYLRQLKEEGIKVVPQLDTEGKIINVYNLLRLKSVLPIHALIMAGGRGDRLRPLTDNTPKPMLLLKEKPIIEHMIDHLISYGIINVTISVRYLAEQIMDYFGDGSSRGINIDYIIENEPLGTIGCLSKKEDFNFPQILLMNSDLFTNINLETFFIQFCEEDADMCIASVPYSVDIPYAIMDLDESRVINFIEKPRNTHYANAGIYLMKKDLIGLIPKNKFFNATDLMRDLLKAGKKIIHSPITGYWIDIGKHDDYIKAKEVIKHL
jgi:dTDP-glucose pyrophosphorylase